MKLREQEFVESLGDNIRKIRKKKGLTQMQLAVKIENHEQNIGRIERGEVNPTASMLYQIAQGLDVELKELVDF